RPASPSALAVPPVEISTIPRSASACANGTRPVLSCTESRARLTGRSASSAIRNPEREIPVDDRAEAWADQLRDPKAGECQPELATRYGAVPASTSYMSLTALG